MSKPVLRWGGLWRSKNRLDGARENLLFENCMPALFRTRREAREYIEKRYGYIRHRPDLRAEPFGWTIPIAVKVEIRRFREDNHE